MLLDKTELVLFNERWPISNGVFNLTNHILKDLKRKGLNENKFDDFRLCAA